MNTCIIYIAVCLAFCNVVTSDECDNVYCHIGLGFVMNRALPNIPVCGSDGVTYADFCKFKQAHCRNSTLVLAKVGVCS